MARGLNLTQLIYNLRVEIGQSTNPAVSRSTRSRYIGLLNRVQRRLYADFEWPFLGIDRDVQILAGSQYYDFPDDIDMDRAVRIEVMYGGYWQKVGYGIQNKHLNEYNSAADDRSDPVWRWDYYLPEDSQTPQIRVWPLPATDAVEATKEGYLRVYGTQKLSEMVNDNDTCLLDADLLTLYTAAEILAKLKSPDAEAKLENANALYMKLKGRATPSEPFKIGGDTYDPNHGNRREIELRVAYAGQEE